MQAAMKTHQDPAARHDPQASWEESVSAWVDAEDDIHTEDLNTPYGRQLWDTYHLIGDVLRNEDLAIKPSSLFYARVSKAVDGEPPIVAPLRRASHPMRLGLSGLAVAAAVASVAWVAMPYFSSTDVPPPAQVVASANNDAGLQDYLDAHRQIAGVSSVQPVAYDAEVSR